MIKKILSMLCMIALMISVIPATFAEDVIFVQKPLPRGGMQNIIGEEIILEVSGGIYKTYSSANTSTLYEVLETGMRQHQTTISIAAFAYANTTENQDMILDILIRVVHENYDIMSFTGYYPVITGGTVVGDDIIGGTITGVTPMYLFSSLEEDVAARAAMDSKINEYIALAEGIEDVEGKLLIIHDAFSKNNEYATEELENYETSQSLTFDNKAIFTPYGALINNRSVCQGISIALSAIYNKMGIETGFCKSEEINHIWNVVQIGGKWYQLDATWDDPDVIAGIDSDGNNILSDKCFHDYFLCSDSDFSDHGERSGWEYYTTEGEVSCSDNTYEAGRIYSGEYIYNDVNYGGWYGNIAYQDGRYVIDILAVRRYVEDEDGVFLIPIGFMPLYAKRLKADMVASDIFERQVTTDSGDETTTKTVQIFTTSDMAANTICRYAIFEGDKMTTSISRARIPTISQMSVGSIDFPAELTEFKVFFWKEGTQEPVCDAILVD